MIDISYGRGSLFAIFASVLLLAGCSSGVTRSDGGKTAVFKPTPEQPVKQVKVTVSEQVREKMKDSMKFNDQELRAKVQQALVSNNFYDEAKTDVGTVMNVHVTKVRVRSTFNAVMWGAMAGGDSVDGKVSIVDPSGKTLDSFDVSTSYALGGFAGGQDAMRVGWLYEAFAKVIVGQLTGETEAKQTAKRKSKKKTKQAA